MKWARAKANNEFTDVHSDYYRFSDGDGAERMCTAWIPLGNYTVDNSVLCVCEKSHLLKDFDQDDMKAEVPPSFHNFLKNCTWRASGVEMGDVIIFDIKTVHCSTKNISDKM